MVACSFVIILQPPLESFDLCRECVFNKSESGAGEKREATERHTRRDETRERARQDEMWTFTTSQR